MKANILEYKGYHTVVEFDSADNVLRGKIEGIADYVDFECDDLSKIVDEFHTAVDDYLIFCKEVGKEPQKEYKGIFNVRISPDLHRKIALKASEQSKTLNACVEEAISNYVSEEIVTIRTENDIKRIAQEFKVNLGFADIENEEINSNVIPINTKLAINYKEELKKL